MISLDGGGIIGETIHYTMSIALFGSALLVFIYFWRKGSLDMDEAPAVSMLENDDDNFMENPHD